MPISGAPTATIPGGSSGPFVLPKVAGRVELVSLVVELDGTLCTQSVLPLIEWLDGEGEPFARAVGTLVGAGGLNSYSFGINNPNVSASALVIAYISLPLPKSIIVDANTTVQIRVESLDTTGLVVSPIRYRVRDVV